MAWEDIEPAKGRHHPSRAGVSIAWRHNSARGRPVLALSIGRPIALALGWEKGHRLRVQRDRAANRMRLSRSTDGDAKSWAVHSKNGTICLSISLPDVKSERRLAERAAHAIVDGALEVDLPEWMAAPAHPPKLRTARNTKDILAATSPDDAARPDAQDEREAKALLRAGKMTVREIADDFGQPLTVVARWKAEVAAERQAA